MDTSAAFSPHPDDAGLNGREVGAREGSREEMNVLILAPTSNDARLTAVFLEKAKLQPFICASFEELCQRVETGCGALLLAEEVLVNGMATRLAEELRKQPSWSDLPIIIITGPGESGTRRRHLSALEPTGNVSIIERPVRPETLVSTLESAIRSRRRQYQVRSLLEEREKMIAESQEGDRRKDEFLAMLAHELRNPLASVSNAAVLLKDAADLENQAWAAGVVERQTSLLSHLIDDLLDVSRITTGKIRLRKAVIDMAVILERACESARPLITERKHDLICEYEHGNLWLEADPTRIEQIILNLLTNAAKYTPRGGRIYLLAGRKDDEVYVTVRDNGIGIVPKRLPEMFQLFTQGDRHIARSEGGLGIGLTIVQKLAEMHDGHVAAHSDGPDRGSTFTVYLPAAAAQIPVDPMSPRPSSEGGKSLRILVVDDNVDSAVGLAKLLARTGHQVELAHEGPGALARAREQSPEAIVLDIGLPGMDGYEVARRLRQEPHGAQVLLIAVTGYGQEEDRQRALEAGFDHHLVKPVDIARLRKLISEGK